MGSKQQVGRSTECDGQGLLSTLAAWSGVFEVLVVHGLLPLAPAYDDYQPWLSTRLLQTEARHCEIRVQTVA